MELRVPRSVVYAVTASGALISAVSVILFGLFSPGTWLGAGLLTAGVICQVFSSLAASADDSLWHNRQHLAYILGYLYTMIQYLHSMTRQPQDQSPILLAMQVIISDKQNLAPEWIGSDAAARDAYTAGRLKAKQIILDRMAPPPPRPVDLELVEAILTYTLEIPVLISNSGEEK